MITAVSLDLYRIYRIIASNSFITNNFSSIRLDKTRRWSCYEETHRLCLLLSQESIRSLSHLLRPCFVLVRRLLYNPQIGASNVFVFTATSCNRGETLPSFTNCLGSRNGMRNRSRIGMTRDKKHRSLVDCLLFSLYALQTKVF